MQYYKPFITPLVQVTEDKVKAGDVVYSETGKCVRKVYVDDNIYFVEVLESVLNEGETMSELTPLQLELFGNLVRANSEGMKIRIKTNEDDYFLKLLLIVSHIPPFNKLRYRQVELYSHLLTLNHKYRNIPFNERNTLIFSYDNKIQIADKMKINISGIYNILSDLRAHKIIEAEKLLPKYILTKSKELTFIFEDEHDNN